MKRWFGILLLLFLLLTLTACEEAGLALPAGLTVHVIDVGQADSILITTLTKEALLIDGGNRDDGQTVVAYLRAHGVQKLQAVIATHPHEDHIGGLPDVLKAFPPEAIYLPEKAHTTKTFSDLLEAIAQSGAKVIPAKRGVKLTLGEANGLFLAPGKGPYDELNNYSAVLRLTYGKTPFLFMGDAESLAEDEILQSGLPVSADVIKLGHHGSNSSSTKKFLTAVSPGMAVISVGKNNDYGHPSATVTKRLKAMEIPYYRTDEQGTVVLVSDGTTIYEQGGQ